MLMRYHIVVYMLFKGRTLLGRMAVFSNSFRNSLSDRSVEHSATMYVPVFEREVQNKHTSTNEGVQDESSKFC